jgi:hypothetical protein
VTSHAFAPVVATRTVNVDATNRIPRQLASFIACRRSRLVPAVCRSSHC